MTKKFNIIQCFILFFSLNFIGVSQVSTSFKQDSNIVIKKADADGIIWFNAQEKPLNIVGFEWIKQDSVYRRLPIHPQWKITKDVDWLASHTAGGQVRFNTNSKIIYVRVELTEKSGMYHMPATGQSGFDLYIKENGFQRYFMTTRFHQDSICYQSQLFKSNENKFHDFTINFPLYNGVKSLQVGVEKESTIQAPSAFSFFGKFVIYGTSITQGGVVSRPGMAYTNILSRKFDAQFVNLGFSGSGKGESAMAHLINQISDVSFIILDYEANANETIINTLSPFVTILRKKHQDIPILIMSKIKFSGAFETSNHELLMSNLKFQMNLVSKRKAAGDKNIYFLDGSKVLGEDYYECTVDGVHPSDLGSRRIADALAAAIENILIGK